MKIWALKKLGTQSGFSLLEMLLVVLILSTLAFSTLDFVDNKDNQARFEDTRRRLQLIRKAVVGESGAVYNGQRLLSGYAFDNGVLPADIQGLLGKPKPSGFDSYGLKDPIFDPQPDANGINDGVGPPTTTLDNPEEKRFFKGYRNGSYLISPPGTVVAFYDGWDMNNTIPVSPPGDYGWQVTGLPTSFTAKSFGANREPNAPPLGAGYDSDISITVIDDDWTVDVDGWAVTIRNESGTDLAVASPGCVRASLITYLNDGDAVNAYNWKRLTSNCIPGNAAAISDGSCLDGNADGMVGDDGSSPPAGPLPVPCSSEVQVTFPPEGNDWGGGGPELQPATRIPAGKHILLLVVDNDGVPHNGSDDDLIPLNGSPEERPCEYDNSTGTDCIPDVQNSTKRITTNLTFFPRTPLPDPDDPQFQLVIR